MHQTQTRPQEYQLLTIAQLVVSGLGLVLALLAAGGLALFGLFGLFGRSTNLAEAVPLFSMAWISLLVGLLAVPSVIFSIQRLRSNGKPFRLSGVNGLRLSSMTLLLWPLVLFLGSVIARQNRLAWLLLPPLQLLAIGLPIFLFIEIARHRLPAGSFQRGWGLINFSVFITTPALMIVEVVVLVVLVIVFAVWANTQPVLLNQLQAMAQRLITSQGNPENILPLLAPWLRNPLVIFGSLALIAGLIPMIEELLKPLAVWALANHQLTPAEGFASGALCGASFALIESLLYLSNPTGESWAILAIGRAGTGLLHTTTTALMGWALASAWKKETYLQLGAAYLLASLLHGLWNGISILTGFSAAINNPPADLRFLLNAAKAGPFAIGGLVIVLFLLLWGSNRALSRSVEPVEVPENVGPFKPL